VGLDIGVDDPEEIPPAYMRRLPILPWASDNRLCRREANVASWLRTVLTAPDKQCPLSTLNSRHCSRHFRFRIVFVCFWLFADIPTGVQERLVCP
jgi:hypothetical protein